MTNSVILNSLNGPPTPAEWGRDFLIYNNLPVTQSNIDAMVAWQQGEGLSSYQYRNPLNTTLPMSGSWSINSDGVKGYPNWQDGIIANSQVMHQSNYLPLLQALQTGQGATYLPAALNSVSGWTNGTLVGEILQQQGYKPNMNAVPSGAAPSSGSGSASGSSSPYVPLSGTGYVLQAIDAMLNQSIVPNTSPFKIFKNQSTITDVVTLGTLQSLGDISALIVEFLMRAAGGGIGVVFILGGLYMFSSGSTGLDLDTIVSRTQSGMRIRSANRSEQGRALRSQNAIAQRDRATAVRAQIGAANAVNQSRRIQNQATANAQRHVRETANINARAQQALRRLDIQQQNYKNQHDARMKRLQQRDQEIRNERAKNTSSVRLQREQMKLQREIAEANANLTRFIENQRTRRERIKKGIGK